MTICAISARIRNPLQSRHLKRRQSVFIWNLQESMHPAVSVSTEKKSQLMTADIRRFEWKSQSNYREKMNWFCTWIIKQATRYILSGRILRFTAGFTGMLQF